MIGIRIFLSSVAVSACSTRVFQDVIRGFLFDWNSGTASSVSVSACSASVFQEIIRDFLFDWNSDTRSSVLLVLVLLVSFRRLLAISYLTGILEPLFLLFVLVENSKAVDQRIPEIVSERSVTLRTCYHLEIGSNYVQSGERKNKKPCSNAGLFLFTLEYRI